MEVPLQAAYAIASGVPFDYSMHFFFLPFLQPTCVDRNVTTARNNTWNCPEGFVFNESSLFVSPPSNESCCMVRATARYRCYGDAASVSSVPVKLCFTNACRKAGSAVQQAALQKHLVTAVAFRQHITA
jgi:hypothetical protein